MPKRKQAAKPARAPEFAWMFEPGINTGGIVDRIRVSGNAALRRCIEELSQTEKGRYLLGDLFIVMDDMIVAAEMKQAPTRTDRCDD